MKLGVPTLVNYAGLDALCFSAEQGTLKPTGYMIVDNGGTYDGALLHPPLRELLASRGATVELYRPGRNLGVAASWNWMLERTPDEPIVIANDDVLLGKQTFAEMVSDLASHPFVCSGWALFAQTPECTRRVGYYDENFFPAYYEDSDYAVRLARAGIERVWSVTEPVQHAGCWTTATALGDPEWLRDGIESCRKYFVQKWGAMPSDTFGGYYAEPFNGSPPPGWSLRP
jgi:GT2 family glycosyltransferase